MYASSDHEYSSERLLLEEEEEKSRFQDQDVQTQASKPRLLLKAYAGLISQVMLFLTSITLLLTTWSQYQDLKRAAERKCYDFVPQWSPALESVQDTGHLHRFDGSFATPNAFKGTPKPEIDVSWDDITYATGTSQAGPETCLPCSAIRYLARSGLFQVALFSFEFAVD